MNWRDTARTVLTLLALVAGVVYLLARATTLGSGWLLALSVPLFLAELVALAQFSLFALVAWHRHEASANRDGAPRTRGRSPIAEADLVIDVRHRDADALERTLVGARSMRSVRRTIVVDSAEREDVAETANSLGASLVIDSRPDHDWVEVLLDVSGSDVVAWLDAGQVPAPDFVHAGCARLADPAVAVWQSAVGLLNVDSLVHIQRGRDEDAVFRTVVGPGLDSLGAAPWTGPGSLVRRQALELLGSVSGSPTGGIQEWLTRLHSAGWSSAYDEEPRVRAIAPDDLDEYLVDRKDRASAALALFMTRGNPLVRRGLTLQQRVAHLTMASMFVTGIRQMTVVMVLIATLLTGQLPFDGPLRSIVVLWVIATATAALSRRSLADGSMKIGDWTRHGWRTVGADLAAIASLLARRTEDAVRTPDSATGIRTLGRLRTLTAVVITLDVALLVRGATIAFETFLPAFAASERLLVVSFGLFMLVPMVDVLQLVVSRKQRRKTFRLATEFDVVVGETPARTIDLAISGVGVLLPFSPSVGSVMDLRLMLPGTTGKPREIEATAIVRAASLDPSGLVRVGFEFEGLTAESRRSLIEYCMVDTARGRQPAELSEPHLLTIERPAEHRVHPLRALTAISAMASIGFLFFGPSAASAAETATEVYTIQVLDTSGNTIAGPSIRVYADETRTWERAGDIPESGKLEFKASVADLDDPSVHVEVVWAGSRLVLPVRSSEISVELARLGSAGADVVEVDLGDGWLPLRDQTEFLPGPIAIRLGDGTVLKATLQPAHVLDIGSGKHTPIEPTTTTKPSEEPAEPARAESPVTTASPTTTSTSSSTSEPSTSTSTEPTTPPEAPATTGGVDPS